MIEGYSSISQTSIARGALEQMEPIGKKSEGYSSFIKAIRNNFSSINLASASPQKEDFRHSPVYIHERKIKILTKEMKEDIFYLVSYKGEKYAVRKLDENRVEFREVEE